MLQHIEHRDDGTQGEWFINRDGTRIAEMAYQRGQGVLVMTHTWVDESLRGQGVARKLLDEAVRYVRAHALKMELVCPYVKSQFAKDASLADLRA